MRCALGVLACLLGLALSGAHAQPPQGGTVSGSVVVNGRAVPLPPGEWKALGSTPAQSAPTYSGAGSPLGSGSVLLAQEQSGRLSALVSIVASERFPYVTYPNWETMACARTNASLRLLMREGGESFRNCADVRTWSGTTQRPANVNARWVPYFDTTQARPGWAPSIFHTAWVSIADRSGSMDVIYHFSPETRGFARDDRPWAQNGWNPANQNDAQKAYIVRLADWLRDAHARARRGFLYGSTDPALPF